MAKLTGTARLILETKKRSVVAVAPDDAVLRALELMDARNVRALLVLDSDRLCGILTEHDYARGVELKGRTARETRVREIMTADPVCVAPDDSVEQCNLLMHRHGVHSLPGLAQPVATNVSQIAAIWAVQGALLLGILTVLVFAFRRVAERFAEGTQAAVAGSLLAAMNTASESTASAR